MKKLGKSSKKGFTLVELIVVLVILAVLAAMLVPALVGYIDRAKKEKEFQAASTVYAAAQALATEDYGRGIKVADFGNSAKNSKFTKDEIYTLTGVTVNAIKYQMKGSTDNTIDAYTVEKIEIQFKDGESWYTYTVNDSTWGTADSATLGKTMS